VEVTTAKEDIMKTFVTHYKKLFNAADTDEEKQHKFLEEIEAWMQLSPEEQTDLAKPLDKLEVLEAVRASPKGKSPGIDGIPYEFYKEYWDIVGEDMVGVLNEILQRGDLSGTQKQGIIILIPKTSHPISTKDFRPITLLTSDYKILTKVLANRLKVYLVKLVNIAQKGCVPGRTILDAISTIRDVIAYKNTVEKAGCILSIDFQSAYDVVDHGYLLKVLGHHKLGKGFINYIRCILRGGTSRIQINGHMSQPFPIHRSIRQGCPLSMTLYIFALNPLLYALQQHRSGVRILNHVEFATAYADDVTIFLDSEQDVASIKRALDEYRHVSGACINTTKSKALSIGEWDKSVNIYNINYQTEIKILGIWFTNNMPAMSPLNWEPVVRNIRLAAQELSIRNSCLLHKIWYVQTYVLSKAWYIAQILPIENRYVRQINGAIAYCIWTRNIFRVPMTTLQKGGDEGGLAMTDIECKCKALLLSRGYKLFNQQDSFTRQWLTYCFQFADIQNPPPQYKCSTPGSIIYKDFLTRRELHCSTWGSQGQAGQ
jgi:hypothetical protein